jgi:glycosyltransferase involved in cell wall biosynthesis
MKLMFYINAIHHGGAERVMVNLANHFANIGHDVILVTSFRDSWEYSPSKKVRRVSLFECAVGNFIARNIKLTLALRTLLKKENPESLISFMAEPNFRAVAASFGMQHKKIISVRNDPNKEYPNLVFRTLAKILYRFANHVVFQTEDARKWFPVAIQKKSSIILNPVDEIFYKTKFEGQRRDIVTTGRLVPQKNHKLLICAFAKIADKTEDNLYIYGEGELRSELEQLVSKLKLQNRIFLPGAVKNVADTIKSAKLFVLSSDYEGMPNSLMEAMALGIPCISTDCPCGGPRMLLNKSFLLATRDETQLENALWRIIDNQNFKDNYKIKPDCFRLNVTIKDWLKVLS